MKFLLTFSEVLDNGVSIKMAFNATLFAGQFVTFRNSFGEKELDMSCVVHALSRRIGPQNDFFIPIYKIRLLPLYFIEIYSNSGILHIACMMSFT